MGPVKGVLLDQSFLFSGSDGEDGSLHLLPGAQDLLLRLQYSGLHVGISYKAGFSSQEEASIRSVAVLYTLQLILFDASCPEQSFQEISSAWEISADTCVFVTTELDEVIFHTFCSQSWAIVFQGSRNAVSAMPGVTTIEKLQDLLFTLCHLNKMALGDSIVAVGYVMKWTREKDFLKRGAFPILPTSHGLTFVSINLDLQLIPQLQVVDLILHKVTDEILSIDNDRSQSISEGIRFSDGIQQLQRYMGDMHYCIVDPFENIIPLLDRVATQLILQDLVEINDPSHCRIRTPHYLKISSFDEPNLLERIDQAQLFLPAIVKPQIACGVSDAHTMAVVFNKDDFLGVPVPLPAVIQEYVDHGSIVYKFYVLGKKVFYAIRGSTPNASSLLLSSGNKGSSIVVFDSLKSLPVDSIDNQKSEVGKEKLDLEIVVSAAMWLREKLHLTIFGFDVV
ncbi:hypothetical protein SUGI_1051890, partial [Cryptomeria japonica]